MPKEYFGEIKKSGGFTLTTPREWTSEEILWVEEKIIEGFSVKDISEAIGRSEVSISIKMKRNKKSDDTYNKKHRMMKYAANDDFIYLLNPKSVLDVFAGNSFYTNKVSELTTNDTDEKFLTDYHIDSLKLLCTLYAAGKKYDVIDLDPYGSAYDCFDLAIKMARKGIAISFGEWGHKRWRRYDFVRPRYGIDSESDFVVEKFILEFQRIAAINKKIATVMNWMQYGNFLRVYFSLDRLVVTEQWGDDGEK